MNITIAVYNNQRFKIRNINQQSDSLFVIKNHLCLTNKDLSECLKLGYEFCIVLAPIYYSQNRMCWCQEERDQWDITIVICLIRSAWIIWSFHLFHKRSVAIGNRISRHRAVQKKVPTPLMKGIKVFMLVMMNVIKHGHPFSGLGIFLLISFCLRLSEA